MSAGKRKALFAALLLAEALFAVFWLRGLTGRQEVVFGQDELLIVSDTGEAGGAEPRQGFYVDNSYGTAVVTPDFYARRGIYTITAELQAGGIRELHDAVSRVVAVDDPWKNEGTRLVASERINLNDETTGVVYRADFREDALFRVVNTINPLVDGQYVLVNQITVTRMVGKTLLHELTVLLVLFALLDFVLFVFAFRKEAGAAWCRENGLVLGALCGIVFFACVPLLKDGMQFGDDVFYHLRRIFYLAEGIADGMFPVKIQAWSHGYGYAVGVGYGDMFLIPSALLYLLGFPLSFCYEFYIALVTALAAWFSYYAFSRIGGDRRIGLAGSALYTLAGFRLTSIYAGATAGEFGAFSFYPLIVLGMWGIYSESGEKRRSETALAVGVGFVIGCHTLSTLMAAITILLFCVFWIHRTLTRRILLSLLRAAGKAILLSLWFLVPVVDYLFTMNLNTDAGGSVLWRTALNPAELLVAAADPNGVNGGYYYLGFVAAPVLFAAAGILLSGRIKNRLLAGGMLRVLLLTLLLAFLSTALFPWHWLAVAFPALYQALTIIQFPWHFLSSATALLATIAVLCMRALREDAEARTEAAERHYAAGVCRAFAVLLIACVVTQSGVYLSQVVREGRSIWQMSGFWLDEPWTDEFSIRGADNAITQQIRGITAGEGVSAEIVSRHGMTIRADVENSTGETARLEFPLWAYRGYAAKAGGRKLAAAEAPDHRVEVEVPAGYAGEVTVGFREPWFWRLAELASLCAWIFLIVCKVWPEAVVRLRGMGIFRSAARGGSE